MRRLVLLTGVLGLAACGAGSVSADEVTSRTEDALAAQLGGDVRPDVSCPGDLPAETGAELRCTATIAGSAEAYGVTVTVTSVEDGEARFDIQVDDQPSG